MVVTTALAIISLALPGAKGDSALSRIERMVSHPAVMCGDFEQIKTLVGLQHPVRSTGRFCVMTERGVLWSTRAPFPSTLRLTREEIVESQGDQITSRLAVSQEPGVGIISGLLFSVLGGDLKQLQDNFDIDAAAQSTTWRAHLVPKEDGMRRVIRGIQLSGGEFIRHVTILEASGDRTDIAFTNIATGTTALRTEDIRAFGPPTYRRQPEK